MEFYRTPDEPDAEPAEHQLDPAEQAAAPSEHAVGSVELLRYEECADPVEQLRHATTKKTCTKHAQNVHKT